MKLLGLTAIMIVIGAGLACFMMMVLRWVTPDPRVELSESLTRASLTVCPETWRELYRRGQRRRTWGIIGGGLGYGLGFMISIALDGQIGQAGLLFALAVSFAGIQFGRSLSSQLGIAHTGGSPRVSSLQPHGLRDYLRPRDIAVECACAVGGLAVATAGVTILLVGSHTVGSTACWLALALGLFMSVVSLAALLLQRRLVRSPMLAEDPSALVANDLALATGLRDLTNAVGISLFQSGWLVVLALGLTWWQDGPGLLIVGAVVWLAFGPRIRPDRIPVARRLAGMPTA